MNELKFWRSDSGRRCGRTLLMEVKEWMEAWRSFHKGGAETEEVWAPGQMEPWIEVHVNEGLFDDWLWWGTVKHW